MTFRTTLVAAVCTLVLVGCNRTPSTETTETPPASATAGMPATSSTVGMPATSSTVGMPAPSATAGMPAASSTAGMPAASTTAPTTGGTPTAAGEKPAAVVKDCATTVQANDAMQYDVGSITIPASCNKFTINLKHTGTMAVTAMGHNVVISKDADMQGVLADGMAAGAGSDYVKAGDARVVAHTKLVGGGQSTSVSFATSKIKSGGPYDFFCSFPGHAAVMKGSIAAQ